MKRTETILRLTLTNNIKFITVNKHTNEQNKSAHATNARLKGKTSDPTLPNVLVAFSG
jgi:hypothetical protein